MRKLRSQRVDIVRERDTGDFLSSMVLIELSHKDGRGVGGGGEGVSYIGYFSSPLTSSTSNVDDR